MAINQLRMSQLIDMYKKRGLTDDEAFEKAQHEAAVHTVQKKLSPNKPSTLELLWYGKDWNKKKGKDSQRGKAYNQ